MDENAKLEAMRALLYQEPSLATFERLYALFPQGRIGTIALEYALSHLARWPSKLKRPVPDNWYNIFLGQFAPACLLCNQLKPHPNVEPSDKTLATLGTTPHLANIKRFEFEHNSKGPQILNALVQNSSINHIVHLSLRFSSLQEHDLGVFTHAPCFRDLKYLDLTGNQLTPTHQTPKTGLMEHLRNIARGWKVIKEDDSTYANHILALLDLNSIQDLNLRQTQLPSRLIAQLRKKARSKNVRLYADSDDTFQPQKPSEITGDIVILDIYRPRCHRELEVYSYEEAKTKLRELKVRRLQAETRSLRSQDAGTKENSQTTGSPSNKAL